MKLFRRQSRSVYRVYAEDEYLDGGQPPLELDGQEPSPEVQAPRRLGEWSPGALLLAGLIVAVAVAALAIVLAAGDDASPRPAGTTTTPVRGNRVVELYRPRRPASRRRHRRRSGFGVHMQARPGPTQPRAARVLEPTVAVAPSTPAPAGPHPQLEFGFER